MKKVTLALALFVSFGAAAQVLNVTGIEPITLPEGTTKVAAISPAGDYVLATDDGNRGLTKLELATNATQVVTTAENAGYNVTVSPDGNSIVYREATWNKNHLRKVAVKSHNLATGAIEQLVKPTRELQGVAVAGSTAMTMTGKKMNAKALGKDKAVKGTMLYTTQNYRLTVSENGKTRELLPLGADARYIWPQLSPNGTKALFFVSGDAAYVCDLNGTNVKRLGALRAAKWLDDNTVVGMVCTDDGYIYTSSSIVAMTLDGHSQTLTDDNVIAMYPQVTTGKIAFSTPAGEAYIINYTK